MSNSLDLPEGHFAGREAVDDRFPQPPHAAMYHELHAAIGLALQTLPVQQRAALELKSLGCSLSDIAASLDVTEPFSIMASDVSVERRRRLLVARFGPAAEEWIQSERTTADLP